MPARLPERLTPLAASLGLQPLFGDIHNHCALSYGHGRLEDALERASLQLDFVSVTGHADWPDMPTDVPEVAHIVDFHTKGFAKLRQSWTAHFNTLRRFERAGSFSVFPGYEIHSSAHGDYTVVFADLDAAPLQIAASPGDLKQALASLGDRAFAFPHHIGYRSGARGINWETFDEALSPFVEIFCRVGTMDCSIAPLTEPDMRTTHPALWIGPSKCQLKLGRYLRGVKFLPSGFQRDQSSCEPGNRIGPRHARTVGLVPDTPAAVRGAGGSPAARPHCQEMSEKEAGSLLLTHDDRSQPTADMSVEYTQSLDTLFRAKPEVSHPPVEVAAETRHTR